MVVSIDLEARLSAYRDKVEESLEELVNKEMAGPSAEAMAMARTVLMAGGKRWRPVLTLLAHEAAGGEPPEGDGGPPCAPDGMGRAKWMGMGRTSRLSIE